MDKAEHFSCALLLIVKPQAIINVCMRLRVTRTQAAVIVQLQRGEQSQLDSFVRKSVGSNNYERGPRDFVVVVGNVSSCLVT